MAQEDLKEVQVRLGSIRRVLLTRKGESFLPLFDELMQEGEFGLALSTLCDYILDPEAEPVSKSIVDEIVRLGIAMGVDDSRFEELQKRCKAT